MGVDPLVSADKIDRPLMITLLGTILDVSVICITAFTPDRACLAIGADETLRVHKMTLINSFSITIWKMAIIKVRITSIRSRG
jgi:hypothetical protein